MKKISVKLVIAALLFATGLQAQSLQDGVNDYYAERFKSAKSTFEKLIAANPNNIEANYWLGQTYFVRGQYEKAAKSFLEGYQAYPKSAKAPDYLLKIGSSLAKINQKEDACAVFAELKSKYPNSPVAKERMPAEKKAAGCK